MLNYFNYFTEIEERFQRRRGSLLMLSTLDWALIETWREAGLPLAVVLRGIDDAFDRYEARALRAKGRVRKVNGLAWCVQSVMAAAEAASEAAVGGAAAPGAAGEAARRESGFEAARVARFLEGNAAALEGRAGLAAPADGAAGETADRLRALAAEVTGGGGGNLEALDRTLGVLEERLMAALVTATPEAELAGVREAAAAELAPYRAKMPAMQVKQVQQQFLQKRLMEARGLPRLSLFYMSHE